MATSRCQQMPVGNGENKVNGVGLVAFCSALRSDRCNFLIQEASLHCVLACQILFLHNPCKVPHNHVTK